MESISNSIDGGRDWMPHSISCEAVPSILRRTSRFMSPVIRSIMTSNDTIPPDAILNPYTPLAFLTPDAADQYQVMLYVYVAILAAYTWDWLMAIPEEYKIIRKARFSTPNVVYFFSRFGTFGSTLATAMRIAPIDNCNALRYVAGTFAMISVPSTSLLFFFRVKAIYNNSKIVTALFGFLCLAIGGVSVLIMLGRAGQHIPYTRRCTEGVAHSYTLVPVIMTALNDTLVYIAISYRLATISMVSSTWRARAKSFFTGEGLHHLSKALLESGQVYYFVTIGVAIASVYFLLSPSASGETKATFGSVYFPLASAMTCRVYRAVLLGIITEQPVNTIEISSALRAAAKIQYGSDDDVTKSEPDVPPNLSIGVAV